MRKICVFAPDSMDWTGNGLAVLVPTSCEVTEEAGGEYELSMTHPCDPWGKWKYLVTDALIRVPVPVQTVPPITPQDVAYWKVKDDVTDEVIVYAKPLIYTVDESTTYDAWSPYTFYGQGINWPSYCYYQGRAWVFIGHEDGVLTQIPDMDARWQAKSNYSPQNPGKWTGGGKVGELEAEEVFVKLGDYNSEWMRVRIAGGVEGYVKTKYCEYYEAMTDAFPAREIKEQCFRIYSISVDSEDMSVTVNARHISYDLRAMMVGDCIVGSATPSTAITILQASMLLEDVRTIATNIGGGYPVTADWSWINAINALLDEEDGMVHQLKAKLIRDNNDFFILKDDEVDNGFAIEYGKNLIGVNWEFNVEDVITRILPKAQNSDGSLLLLPERFIDSTLIDQYPVKRMEVLDTEYKVGESYKDETGTTITLTVNDCYRLMRRDCNRRYNLDRCDVPTFSLEVEFLNLGDTEEYAQYRGLQLLAMYDTVTIRHSILNFISKMKMRGYTYDCILQKYVSARFDGYYDDISRVQIVTRPELAMTDNNDSGCLVSASTVNAYSNRAFKSFDYNMTTGWIPQPSDQNPWIQIQLDQALTEIKVYVYSRTSSDFMHPTAGVVYGSNDGSYWTALKEFSGWDKYIGGLVGVVECENEDPYQYVRLSVTATTTPATDYLSIGYIYLTGKTVL